MTLVQSTSLKAVGLHVTKWFSDKKVRRCGAPKKHVAPWGHAVTTRYKPEGCGFDSVLEFFINIILPAPLLPWGPLSASNMSTTNTFWGVRWPACRADNLTTSMCRMSWNVRASTSWKPLGLSSPVRGWFTVAPYWQLLKTNNCPTVNAGYINKHVIRNFTINYWWNDKI